MTAQTGNETKYFIYARKSTESEERQQLSIPAQLDELNSFAKKEGLKIVDSLIESKSAKAPGRKIFNSMIERIQLGEASGILSWHADRLARNAVDAGIVVHLLDTGKLKDLKFPTVDFQNNPQGKFMLSIAFGTSKYYIDNLAINSKRGMLAKAKRGWYPTLAPMGYKNDRLNKTIVLNNKVAPAITKAFQLFATGKYTLTDISKVLFKQGLATKKTKNGPGGLPLRIETIRYVLKNPFYYGTFKYSGEYYQGKHKPIISKKLFDRVQKVLVKRCWSCQRDKRNQKRKYQPFIFSRLIKCAECGYHITVERKHKYYKTTGRTQHFTYYHCTKKSKTVKCNQGFTRQNSALKDLFTICQKVSLPEKKGDWLLARLTEDEQKKQDQLSQVKSKLTHQLEGINTKLSKLLTLHLDNLISREEYLTQKNQLMSKRKTIEENLINLADYQLDNVTKAKDFVRLTIKAGKISRKYLKTLKKTKNQPDRIEPNQGIFSPQEDGKNNPLIVDLAGFLKKAELNLMLKEQKVYHIKQNPWARFGGSAPSRNIEA